MGSSRSSGWGLPQRSRMSKVCSSLRQLVRDWTADGAEERRQCYGPVLAEMQRVLPITPDNKNKLMVFLPGSGLSRLMVELCACVRVARRVMVVVAML